MGRDAVTVVLVGLLFLCLDGGSALALLLFLFTGRRLSRLEGGLLLLGYGAYLVLSFTVFGG